MEESLPPGTAGHERYNYRSVSGDDGYDDIEDGADFKELGGYAPSQGYVAGQAQSQVGGDRGIDLTDILYLAKAVEDLVNPYDPEREKRKKKQQTPKKKRKKKQYYGHNDYDLSL